MSENGAPGRYNRSTNALVGSLIVTVLAVGAFVVFRAVFSRGLEVAPDDVDYRQTVGDLQDSGFFPVYPPTLPAGWKATNVDFTQGDPPAWGLSLLTDAQEYIGIQESTQPVDDLLATYVDDHQVDSEAPLSTPGALAPTWAGWSDSGGDHAYTATVGDQVVIVFGTAPVTQLADVVRELSVARLPGTVTPASPTSSAATSR